MTGTITWNSSEQLPVVSTPSGTTVNPIAIGGRYIITDAGGGVCTRFGQPCMGDDDRFYFFLNSTGRWVRLDTGTPGLPASQADIDQGQPYRAIADARNFTTTNGDEFGVWHVNHRINTYAWP